MGPTLLVNLLELNETQEDVLQIAFSLADDEGLLLLDLKDLRAMLNWVSDNAEDIERNYSHVSSQSVTAILRRLLVLQEAGGDIFFGEPAIRIEHLLQNDFSGRGVVSILDATMLYQSPRIYATFLLWLLSELMEELPERYDADLPKPVFFDEAHLLFSSAPKALLEKITSVDLWVIKNIKTLREYIFSRHYCFSIQRTSRRHMEVRLLHITQISATPELRIIT